MDMQRGQGSSPFEATQKMAKEKWKQEIDNLDISEEKLYEGCLQILKAKFQGEGRELFYRSFENTYRQIYYKRKVNKRRYWSTVTLVLLVLGTGGSGTVAAASLLSIVNTFLPAMTESDGSSLVALVQSHSPLFLVFLLALGFLTFCLAAEFERRNYKDTWVRHSTAYYRLNIAMIRFLSNLMNEDDFMKEVLQILETNLTRFEHGVNSSQSTGTKTEAAD